MRNTIKLMANKNHGNFAKALISFEKEDNDLMNILGNMIDEVEVVECESKNREAFKVVIFSVVSKDNDRNKHYTNCSAYGKKVIF